MAYVHSALPGALPSHSTGHAKGMDLRKKELGLRALERSRVWNRVNMTPNNFMKGCCGVEKMFLSRSPTDLLHKPVSPGFIPLDKGM